MNIELAYIGLASFAFFGSLMMTPLALKVGRKMGFMDAPGDRKIHAAPMVRCGGLGIWAGFMMTFGLIAVMVPYIHDTALFPASLRGYTGNISFVWTKLAALLCGGFIAFATGLWDDRSPLGPKLKLLCQIVAILPLLMAGITVKCFLPWEWVGWGLTVLWVLLITNAFNLLDNMNGLSAGLVVVVCLNFFLVSYAGEAWFMMAMFALLGGSALGFLPYNFPKAKLFMGDSGALFMGYMIGALSIMVTYYDGSVPTALPVVSPIVILGIPLYDSLSVMWIRKRAGKPLMVGDRNHISHRLEALGFSRVQAVVLVWAIALVVGFGACNLRELHLLGAVVALLQTILWFVILHVIERRAGQSTEESDGLLGVEPSCKKNE